MAPMVAACVKWTDLRPEVDPLTGALTADPRCFGASMADRAAAEVALRLGEAWGAPVTFACAGPPDVEPMLAELGASGASRLVRVDVPLGSPSPQVAAVLAAALGGVDVVVCGDHSLDRGSGAVPAFLAHHLGAAQALGLTAVDVEPPGRSGSVGAPAVVATRRIGLGRSERVRAAAPAVLSVEGSVATLRRASLTASLAAAERRVEVAVTPSVDVPQTPRLVERGPWRPRAKVLPAPEGDDALERIVNLTGALVERTPPRTVELDTEDAADAIVAQLHAWGYLA